MSKRIFNAEKIIEQNEKLGVISNDIAELFKEMQKTVEDSVGVEDGSIYGKAADQLILDWDNTSSDFSNFIEKFADWSKVVVSSKNKYEQFEAREKQFANDHPLGGSSLKKGIYYNEPPKIETINDSYKETASYIPKGKISNRYIKNNDVYKIACVVAGLGITAINVLKKS